jgi:hypothetical protein
MFIFLNIDHLEFKIQITALLPSMILPAFPLTDLLQIKYKHNYAAIHEWTNILVSTVYITLAPPRIIVVTQNTTCTTANTKMKM